MLQEQHQELEKHVMSARKVAEIGYRAMMKGKRTEVPGLYNKTLVFINHFTPKTVIMKFAMGMLAHK